MHYLLAKNTLELSLADKHFLWALAAESPVALIKCPTLPPEEQRSYTMDTYGLIAACRERQQEWAERSFTFECEFVEQLAHAHDALDRSRDSLNQTSQILTQSPLVDTHRTTLPGRGLNI